MKPALLATLALVVLLAAAPASAQRRGEYLTNEEVEAVRTAQAIDKRAAVFMKVADRRLLAITDPAAKLSDKEIKVFGPLPTGSPADLLDDYRRALDELMEKLDDAHSRKGKSAEFEKARGVVLEALERQSKQLAAVRAQLKDEHASQVALKAAEAADLLRDGLSGSETP